MATWQDDDCDSSTSPIVYPIVSYGDYNPDGTAKNNTTFRYYNRCFRVVYLTKLGYYGFNGCR